jgi:hypothetical protein
MEFMPHLVCASKGSRTAVHESRGYSHQKHNACFCPPQYRGLPAPYKSSRPQFTFQANIRFDCAVKTKRHPLKDAFWLKVSKKSHKTYIKSRTPKRIWFSQEFCTAEFTYGDPDRGGDLDYSPNGKASQIAKFRGFLDKGNTILTYLAPKNCKILS